MPKINLKEVYEPERRRLEELFDEQVEEIKKNLVAKALYKFGEQNVTNFVALIDKYEKGYVKKNLVIASLDGQRDRISRSSTLLQGMVDTKTIYETLTYVLREFNAVDEDGYIIEEEY